MLSFPGSLKVYLALAPTDMRKSFNGLYALAREQLDKDPLSGSLFVFSNGARNRLKILYWDGTGLWVLAKRLEKGTFAWPDPDGKTSLCLRPEALSMLLDGIDLRGARMRPWYER